MAAGGVRVCCRCWLSSDLMVLPRLTPAMALPAWPPSSGRSRDGMRYSRRRALVRNGAVLPLIFAPVCGATGNPAGAGRWRLLPGACGPQDADTRRQGSARFRRPSQLRARRRRRRIPRQPSGRRWRGMGRCCWRGTAPIWPLGAGATAVHRVLRHRVGVRLQVRSIRSAPTAPRRVIEPVESWASPVGWVPSPSGAWRMGWAISGAL